MEAQAVLETHLTDPDSPRLTIGIPDSCQESYSSAQAFRARRDARTIETSDLELHHLLQLVQDKPEGERLKALGDVRVTMFSDDDYQTPAGVTTNGKEWLIADITMGTDRLFYGNGKWFEVGAGFLETLEEELAALFSQPQTITLPPWPKGPPNSKGHDSHDEDWFNHQAAKPDGYLLFDKKDIVTEKFRGGGLEICDVLGPENQLICIKKAPASTAPLNHLFAQGVVAVETLRSDLDIRTKFLEQVAAHTPDHRLLHDFGTLRVVFGILLKDGQDIRGDCDSSGWSRSDRATALHVAAQATHATDLRDLATQVKDIYFGRTEPAPPARPGTRPTPSPTPRSSGTTCTRSRRTCAVRPARTSTRGTTA